MNPFYNTFTLVTHNIGGQTYKENEIEKFVDENRGEIIYENDVRIEKLNRLDKYPSSLEIPANIYLFQEYIKPDSNERGDLALYDRDTGSWNISHKIPQQTKEGETIWVNPRYQIYENYKLYTPFGIQDIILINYHGQVLNTNTSFNQWKNTINFFNMVNEIIAHQPNVMITGDFNIDFTIQIQSLCNDLYQTLNTSSKKNVRNNAKNIYKKLYASINTFIRHFNRYPFDSFETNTWALLEDDSQYKGCVDYFFISKYFNGIMDVQIEILSEYMCDKWEYIGITDVLHNDFDHTPLRTIIYLQPDYQIRNSYFDEIPPPPLPTIPVNNTLFWNSGGKLQINNPSLKKRNQKKNL